MKAITSFAEASRYLQQFHGPAETKYGLDVMRQLLDYLGNPQNNFKAVHIAGTSGKTSTAYYMAALITASGAKAGLTVSPHVDGMNERVQLNGQPLSEDAFCKALSEFAEILEGSPVKPSWFELTTALAYWYFAKEQVDYVVAEVGLGGRLDATNVIDREDKVCVITDIGFDHMKVLGNSLAEIAEQKAGIIQPRNVVFTYKQPDEVVNVLDEKVAKENAQLIVISETQNTDNKVPDYQFRNDYLAYQVYKFLEARDNLPGLSNEQLKTVQDINIPGRMDIRKLGNKNLVMDGAHNRQKMEAFVASFRKLYPGVKPAVLLGLRDGKDYESVVPIVADLASRVITTSFETSQDLPIKSMSPEQLAKAFEGLIPAKSVPDQSEALEQLLSSPEDILVITGSLYLLGQLRNRL